MICETDCGLKLVREFHGSKAKLAFQNKVLQHIKASGYQLVDVILANDQQELVTTDKDEVPYIVKDWFDGRECDTKSEIDIMQGVRNLASLHNVMLLLPDEEEEWVSSGDLVDEYERHNRELKKIRNFIRNKRKKNEFELCFIEYYERFFQQGKEILEQLKGTQYGELRSQSLTLGGVCHGDYNHHNILIHKGGMATTNFDKCHYNLQVNDLYQFMRKILEKQNWNEKIGMEMLDQYDKIKPISDEELENLYYQLSYPEKFWKIANHYFNHNKTWIPGRSKEKLENLAKQFDQRESFLKRLL